MSRTESTNRCDVGEQNGLVNALAYHDERHAQGYIDTVDWTTPGLRVTRLRLVSERGHPEWEVSYCHGVLFGEHVDVALPFDRLPKRGLFGAIIDHAKRDGVYAKRLGILDPLVISTLN